MDSGLVDQYGNPVNTNIFGTAPISTNTLQSDVNSGGLSLDGYNTPTSGNTSGTTSTTDPNVLNSYNQAIGNTQSALNNQGNLLNSGNSAIQSSWQNALNQLLLGRNQGEQAYNTNTDRAKQDYVGAKNTIGSQAGSLLSGLYRLLGSRGAGGGSAYNTVAPGAVARGATQQRNDVGQTFGRNISDLTTNWQNYLTGYDNSVAGANSQRDTQKTALQNQIEGNKANLLQTLAQLNAQKTAYSGGDPTAASQPYLDQANSLISKASTYNTAPIDFKTQAYQAPSLDKYTFNPQTPSYQGQGQSNDYYSPYLSALLGKKQPGIA